MRLAVVVPVLNEAAGIEATLSALAPLRARGVQVIVADGGSTDGTADRARPHADHVLRAARGRAAQMNAGAACARDADVLLFLHADTTLPPQADAAVAAAIAGGARWGRFDVTINGRSPWLALVAAAMNTRSRATGIATGDQALFVERRLFDALGGYAALPLMEDIDFSRRALAQARPAALRQRVVTSGRRWDERGVWRTVWQMWTLRWRYFRGADPAALAREYREVR